MAVACTAVPVGECCDDGATRLARNWNEGMLPTAGAPRISIRPIGERVRPCRRYSPSFLSPRDLYGDVFLRTMRGRVRHRVVPRASSTDGVTRTPYSHRRPKRVRVRDRYRSNRRPHRGRSRVVTDPLRTVVHIVDGNRYLDATGKKAGYVFDGTKTRRGAVSVDDADEKN